MTTQTAIRNMRVTSWEKNWAGYWSILFLSHYHYVYTVLLKRLIGHGFMNVVMITKHAYSTGILNSIDRRTFGVRASRRFSTVPAVRRWCKNWEQAGRILTDFIQSHSRPQPTEKLLQEYLDLLDRYAELHITAKNVIDFLSPNVLRRVGPYFTHSRLVTEQVYAQTEVFLRRFGAAFGKHIGLPGHLVLCLTENELRTALHTGRVPARQILAQRDRGYAIYVLRQTVVPLVGKDLQKAEAILSQHSTKKGELRGTTAFPGRAVGIVHVVREPKSTTFHAGEILVTSMTRPEFVPLMKKAAAIVTDAGGLLSHAAIVARELKKPTIIGTEQATQILKNGDRVEVDATNGIIKKVATS